MERELARLLEKIQHGVTSCKNPHIVRFFSSYVLICDEKAIEVTEPVLTYCPLAGVFYRGLRGAGTKEARKNVILAALNDKIRTFGQFSERRRLFGTDTAVPFGASEMLMFALKKKVIDAACVVCDGAGTVIVRDPAIVQGIGARMNGLFYTSSIEGVTERLLSGGAHVLSRDARIDQAGGVEKAAGLGYGRIAVTINAALDEPLHALRELEQKKSVSLTVLALCTTGIGKKRVREIAEYADLIWSCASEKVRSYAGKKALVQLSRRIPVFVMTGKGLDFINAYTSGVHTVFALNPKKQYLIAGGVRGKDIRMGHRAVRLAECNLPVRHKGEPV